MIHARDPALMTQSERQRELGELLALGWRRLSLRRENQLASLASDQPSCDRAVDDREKESA